VRLKAIFLIYSEVKKICRHTWVGDGVVDLELLRVFEEILQDEDQDDGRQDGQTDGGHGVD
jgi:hypothetical protein